MFHRISWNNFSEYTFRGTTTGDFLAGTIFIIFAKLAGFDKDQDDCVTAQARMLFVRKNLGKLKDRCCHLSRKITGKV